MGLHESICTIATRPWIKSQGIHILIGLHLLPFLLASVQVTAVCFKFQLAPQCMQVIGPMRMHYTIEGVLYYTDPTSYYET